MEVPEPGIESEPQLYRTCGKAGPLIHCAKSGIEPTPPRQPELLQLDS